MFDVFALYRFMWELVLFIGLEPTYINNVWTQLNLFGYKYWKCFRWCIYL